MVKAAYGFPSATPGVAFSRDHLKKPWTEVCTTASRHIHRVTMYYTGGTSAKFYACKRLTAFWACASLPVGAIQGLSEGGTIPFTAFLLYVGQLNTLIEQTGWVARIVLGMLLFFSLFSWALIFQKLMMFGRINRQTSLFLRVFRANRTLPDPRQMGDGRSPLESEYAAGFRELESQVRTGNPPGKLTSLNAVTVSMQLAAAEEVRRAESYMPWLATTGSVTPFIGLFGTVWGVMDAFTGLGTAGAASLRAVAPGIAEALITTAAGLFTAVPAVIAYNHFVHDIRELSARMDSFALEVSAVVEKLYPSQRG
jgi:biopolymer transport protein TolQ